MLKRIAVAILLVAGQQPAARADSYTIDPAHTYAYFSVSHQGFSIMRGHFGRSSGKVTLDHGAGNGTVDITIETASVNTGSASRDEHLRSADFFNAAVFPAITYQSGSMKFKGDVPASVEGNLTMNGVTRPVTLTLSSFKCGIHPWSHREACGADAGAQIRRSDFGMTFALPGVGDDIKLDIEVEAYKD